MQIFKKKIHEFESNNNLNVIKNSVLLLMLAVLFITVGFSAFNSSLDINSLSAHVMVDKDIRITKIISSDNENDGISNWEEHTHNTTSSNISLPNSDSSVTYEVEIKNIGNVEMAILDITGLPSNLTYDISNYELKETLCDDNDNTKCKLGAVTKVYLTIKYANNGFDPNNTEYNTNMYFDFRQVFSIKYKGMINYNYISKILEGDTVSIRLVNDIPDEVQVTGASFSADLPLVTISNPVDNVVIKGISQSKYYERVELDGTNFIDTGVYLFNERNIDENFVISFNIESIDPSQTYLATIINAMYEVSPYPGFVYRIESNGSNLTFNSPSIATISDPLRHVERVIIRRYNGEYYLQINDKAIKRLGTYKSGTTFDVPVTIGASLDENENPWRFISATLTDVRIEITGKAKYTIKYNSNNESELIKKQEVLCDKDDNLLANEFEWDNYTFVNWNTAPDGTGISYENSQNINNIANEGETITLYAQWAEQVYFKDREVFYGRNCIYDTNISLYNSNNRNKNYEISFEIESVGTSTSQATLLNAMYEVIPWPGVLFRIYNNGNFEIDMNGGSGSFNRKYPISNNTKVRIRRINGQIIYNINNEEFTGANHSNITSFDTPVSFGCSLDFNNNPQRYYVGTLKNMNVILFK